MIKLEKVEYVESLKDIINIRCDKFKDKVAFREMLDTDDSFKDIKYSKVKEDVNALGTVFIKKLGLKDKKIAVIGENSYRWYVTYMATVCGTGIIVPLDKELPENEILNLLERSKASAIVYSSRKKEQIDKIKDKLPKDMVFIEMYKDKSDKEAYSFDELVEEGKKIVEKGDNSYSKIKIDRDKFMILLFTSGTTGKAKGVMLCHKNICANIVASNVLVPRMTEYTSLSVLPMHHTYEFSLDYIYGTYMGATIAICRGLKYIAKDLQITKPNLFIVVPALVENLSKKIDKSIEKTGKEKIIRGAGNITYALSKVGIDFRRSLFKKIHETLGGNLELFICGAAPIDKEIIKKIESYGITLLQGLGTTETAPLISGTSRDNNEYGTVGKAVANVEVRIDLEKNKDEESKVGEVIVKGDNVMLGYYEMEAETKKVLKNGWLYTGDLGYFNNKGNLVLTGRSKNVIVTANGKNIFPEELETEVNKIPLVNESMVYGKESEDKKDELIVTARVTLDEEYIKEKYGENRPSDDEIRKEILKEIKEINKRMVSYKSIKGLEIKKEDFSKTTTMKIKRYEEIKKKA